MTDGEEARLSAASGLQEALPMSSDRSLRQKTHITTERPPFERIALILQGGGALGSYQAGVYQALAEAGLHPDWVAGISIGAINSALIAGNVPQNRVGRLREFWEAVTASPFGLPDVNWFEPRGELAHSLVNHASSFSALLGGAPNFFKPRVPPPYLQPKGTLEAISYYDTAPLKATLERLVDFDLINAREMRCSVGAVNVRTGNFVYFDNTTHRICPEHVIASGSLPPDSRRPKSKANIIGTAVLFPIRRCSGCSTAGREKTRSPFRSICGARAGSFRAICSKPKRGRRKFATPAAPGWRPINSRSSRSCGAPQLTFSPNSPAN